MIDIKGSFELAVTNTIVLNFVQQPKYFSQCLPNLQAFKETGQGNFQATFKVEVPKSFRVSYLQNLSVNMSFVSMNAPDGVVLKGEGRSAGIKMRLHLNVRVIPKESSSVLSFEGQLDAGLVEKFLGKERLEAMAKEISTRIVECISEKLTSGTIS